MHLLTDGSVRIFSRNGENNTSKYPDVAEIVRSAMQPGTQMFIIDAEVCFYDTFKAHIFGFKYGILTLLRIALSVGPNNS